MKLISGLGFGGDRTVVGGSEAIGFSEATRTSEGAKEVASEFFRDATIPISRSATVPKTRSELVLGAREEVSSITTSEVETAATGVVVSIVDEVSTGKRIALRF